MRVTSKGQVTIPLAIREQLGLLPNTEVDFVMDGKGVRLVKSSKSTGTGRGAAVVRRLSGTGSVRMTTDEIMALTRKA